MTKQLYTAKDGGKHQISGIGKCCWMHVLCRLRSSMIQKRAQSIPENINLIGLWNNSRVVFHFVLIKMSDLLFNFLSRSQALKLSSTSHCISNFDKGVTIMVQGMYQGIITMNEMAKVLFHHNLLLIQVAGKDVCKQVRLSIIKIHFRGYTPFVLHALHPQTIIFIKEFMRQKIMFLP